MSAKLEDEAAILNAAAERLVSVVERIFALARENKSPVDLLNAKQLAKALGVSAPTITAWHQSKVITPAIHEGAVIRFDLTSVKNELAERARRKST